MPRCFTGNHFASNEGDRNCKACQSVQRFSTPKPLPLTSKRLCENLNTKVDKSTPVEGAFLKMKTLQPQTGAVLSLDEVITWYELAYPSGGPQRKSNCGKHDLNAEKESVVNIFSETKIHTNDELDKVFKTFTSTTCLCGNFPPVQKVITAMINGGQLSPKLLESYLKSLHTNEEKVIPSLTVTAEASVVEGYVRTENASEDFLEYAFNNFTLLPANTAEIDSEVQYVILSRILLNPSTNTKVLNQYVKKYVKLTRDSFDRFNPGWRYSIMYSFEALERHPSGLKFLKKIKRRVKLSIFTTRTRAFLRTLFSVVTLTLFDKLFDPQLKRYNQLLDGITNLEKAEKYLKNSITYKM